MEVMKKHESFDSLPKKLQDVVNYLFQDDSGRLYISDSTKIKNVVEDENTNVLKIKLQGVLNLSFKHTSKKVMTKEGEIDQENLSFIIKFANKEEVVFIKDFEKNMEMIKDIVDDVKERIQDIIVDCMDVSLEKIRKQNDKIDPFQDEDSQEEFQEKDDGLWKNA
jgi:hypothetical protein